MSQLANPSSPGKQLMVIVGQPLRAISHWHEYSLRVVSEKVISLVLPLSLRADVSACIARASTCGHSR